MLIVIKKVKGIKWQVAIANVHDSKAAYLLMRVLKELWFSVKVILADGGYRGDLIKNIKRK